MSKPGWRERGLKPIGKSRLGRGGRNVEELKDKNGKEPRTHSDEWKIRSTVGRRVRGPETKGRWALVPHEALHTSNYFTM